MIRLFAVAALVGGGGASIAFGLIIAAAVAGASEPATQDEIHVTVVIGLLFALAGAFVGLALASVMWLGDWLVSKADSP